MLGIAGGSLRGIMAMLPLPPLSVRHRRPNGSIADNCPSGSRPRSLDRSNRPSERRTTAWRRSGDRQTCSLPRGARRRHIWTSRRTGRWVIVGGGSEGAAIGNTAIQSAVRNAARSQWQYCHSAPEDSPPTITICGRTNPHFTHSPAHSPSSLRCSFLAAPSGTRSPRARRESRSRLIHRAAMPHAPPLRRPRCARR